MQKVKELESAFWSTSATLSTVRELRAKGMAGLEGVELASKEAAMGLKGAWARVLREEAEALREEGEERKEAKRHD